MNAFSNRIERSGVALGALCAALLSVPTAVTHACTRVLWNDNELAVVAARTMDWAESTRPALMVFPRGIERDGGKLGPAIIDPENPARWTSKYGSVVTTAYGVGAVDGVNEKGLSVHLNYFTQTDFGPRDPSIPGVHGGLWGQYLLDNAATVAEALELAEGIQPIDITVEGHRATLHLAMEDSSGDSAIVQYIDGERVVHHGREHRVLTNDPRYEEQLAYLATYDFTNATRQTALPGNVDPRHRFVRASYYLQMLREPANEREAVAGVLAIARNASVPFGAPNNLPGTLYNTEYRTATDVTNLRYYFELSTAPNLIWVDLNRLNFDEGAPVLWIDPDDIELAGNVTARMQELETAPF